MTLVGSDYGLTTLWHTIYKLLNILFSNMVPFLQYYSLTSSLPFDLRLLKLSLFFRRFHMFSMWLRSGKYGGHTRDGIQ